MGCRVSIKRIDSDSLMPLSPVKESTGVGRTDYMIGDPQSRSPQIKDPRPTPPLMLHIIWYGQDRNIRRNSRHPCTTWFPLSTRANAILHGIQPGNRHACRFYRRPLQRNRRRSQAPHHRGLNRNGTRISKCLVRFFSDFYHTQNQR
jgi:hypothetical protein